MHHNFKYVENIARNQKYKILRKNLKRKEEEKINTQEEIATKKFSDCNKYEKVQREEM